MTASPMASALQSPSEAFPHLLTGLSLQISRNTTSTAAAAAAATSAARADHRGSLDTIFLMVSPKVFLPILVFNFSFFDRTFGGFDTFLKN